VNEVGRLSVVEGSHAERGTLFVGQGDGTERVDIRIEHRRHFELLATMWLDLQQITFFIAAPIGPRKKNATLGSIFDLEVFGWEKDKRSC
jgi:hypothetical protein